MRTSTARFSSILSAKAILAGSLLCAILSVSVPIASVSADSICRLACCAGHAAHVAGSCMNGSCHAAVRTRKAHRLKRASEAFCGVSNRLGLIAVPIAKLASTTSRNEFAPSKGSAAALIGRSAPDCNGGVSGCANLNRQRNSGSVTDSEHLPLPTNICFGNHREDFARARDELGRRCAPRGPPVLFS